MANTKLQGTYADTSNNDVVSTAGNQSVAGVKTFQDGLLSNIVATYAANIPTLANTAANPIPYFDAKTSGNLGNVTSGSITFTNIPYSDDCGYLALCTVNDNSGQGTCLVSRGVGYYNGISVSGFVSLGSTVGGSAFTAGSITSNAGKVQVNLTKASALTACYFQVYILVFPKKIYT